MAFLDWLFGSESGGEPQTASSHSTQTVPEYISGPTQSVIEEAERLAAKPYTAYEGDRIAPFADDTLSAFENVRQMQGIAPAKAADSYNVAGYSTRGFPEINVADYMNPYLSTVGQQAERELDRRRSQQAIAEDAAAQRAGAFGGARHGVYQAEQQRTHERGVQDMWERLYSGGFDRAQNQFNVDRQQELSGALGMGQLAAQEAQLGYQDINTQLGIGQLQEAQEQRGFDTQYEDFLRQEQYPYESMYFLSDIIRGVPFGRSETTTTSQSTAQPGFFQQAAGLGIAALGTASDLGWRPLG